MAGELLVSQEGLYSKKFYFHTTRIGPTSGDTTVALSLGVPVIVILVLLKVRDERKSLASILCIPCFVNTEQLTKNCQGSIL